MARGSWRFLSSPPDRAEPLLSAGPQASGRGRQSDIAQAEHPRPRRLDIEQGAYGRQGGHDVPVVVLPVRRRGEANARIDAGVAHDREMILVVVDLPPFGE